MKNIFQLTLLLLTFSSFSQNYLKGRITDNQNNPLIGVEIYAPELHKGTLTDLNGSYKINNLPKGKLKITFLYLGYKTVTKEIFINSKQTNLDIELEESIFKIDEIIVSAPFNKLQSENILKIEYLSSEGLKKTGATTLSEGLASISGVSQISTGTSIGKPVIRGLSSNRVLIYTQGVRLENQQFGDEHGLGINENGIESIEVIKGPASLLYGSDALGGVIYLKPEKFAQTNETGLKIGQKYFSNTLGTSTTAAFKSSTDQWKFLARATLNSHADYQIPTNERVTNTRFRENDFKFGLGYNHKNYSSEFRYNFNRLLVGLPEEGIAEQVTISVPESPFQNINNHILSLHNHIFLGNSKLDIDLGYIYNNRSEFEDHHHDEHEEEEEEEHEEHEGELPSLQLKLRTLSYNIKYHFPTLLENLESIIGVQGMRQINKNHAEEILIPNATVNDIGVFLSSNYQWKSSSLQAGIRFDSRNIDTEMHTVIHEDEEHIFNAIDKKYTSFTASLGYKFEVTSNFITRLNVASGFRAPNLAELTSNGVHHGTNRFEIGNNELKTEKNMQFDISLTYDSEHIEIFANSFYNHLNDYIYLSPTGEIEDGKNVFEYTQNNAQLYGGEIGFHLHPHPLDWLHLESSYEMVIGKQNNGDYLPLIPANIIKNTLRAEFFVEKWLKNAYLSTSLHSVLDQNYFSQFETATKGYQLLNLGFGGDFNISGCKFSTNISINNLLNTTYINHLSRLKADGIANQGINAVVGLNFNL